MEPTELETTAHCGVCGVSFVKSSTKARHCQGCGTLPGSAFEAAAQLKKALKLAPIMLAAGAAPWMATGLGQHCDATRTLAVQLAGLESASRDTWAMVAVLMQ